MIRGIHHVAVHVHDLDRMIKFYRDAFGFEVVGEPFGWDSNDFIDRIVDVPDSAARGAMLRCGTC
ncbi:MAG TPA: VOC family protein, partial [Fontimonas sp.]